MNRCIVGLGRQLIHEGFDMSNVSPATPVSLATPAALPGSPLTADSAAGAEGGAEDFASLLAGQVATGDAATNPLLALLEAGNEAVLPAEALPALAVEGDASLLALFGALNLPVPGQKGDAGKGSSSGLTALAAAASDDAAADATQADADLAADTGKGKTAADLLAAGKPATTATLAAKADATVASFAAAHKAALAQQGTQGGEAAQVAQVSTLPVGEMRAYTGPTGQAAPAQVQVAPALSSPQWTPDFASKVVWLARHDQSQAHISINPPQLGPVDVSISLDGSDAKAVFTSPHAEVRQAIENALPRLREAFAEAGLSLGQAGVSAESQREQQANGRNNSNQDNGPRGGPDILPGHAATARPESFGRGGNGLVDTFA